jgi:hypothetical protein
MKNGMIGSETSGILSSIMTRLIYVCRPAILFAPRVTISSSRKNPTCPSENTTFPAQYLERYPIFGDLR